jgi:lipopolysaccharide biosynthesis glycosyltransferase
MRIFVGFDPRESVSYHVASHSILRRSSIPVDITPLALTNLPDFKRDRNPLQSTDFSFTRFLVPYLCDFKGWALFMDCDVLVRADISELGKLCNLANFYKAVYVVKHDYQPKDEKKFLGEIQSRYEKKNWSSVMLFNNYRCRKLTPEFVNSAPGLALHQFHWTTDGQIGELDKDWNHLVGEQPENPNAKIVHFTRGGPWFQEYKDCEFSKEWNEELKLMTYPIK